jgi:hypothetical protein
MPPIPDPAGADPPPVPGAHVRVHGSSLSMFDDTAGRLEDAYDAKCRVLALTIPDREAIVRALEDCPDGLAELRSVLIREHEWRVREGLV